jgi:iron(III) transport system substrate-binding protein
MQCTFGLLRSFPRKRDSRASRFAFDATGSPLSRGRAAFILVALLALSTLSSPAKAQSLAELATYSGPDRTQKLIDGAKKEGTVVIYSSMTVKDMGAIIAAFTKKYGVKATHWRGSSEDVRNRAMSEYRAGRYDADLAETAGPDMEAMVRENLFQKIATPVSKELIPQATIPSGFWIATRLSVYAAGYNTTIIKNPPKAYEDLLDARFKGKLGIEAEDYDWFLTVCSAMGEQKGLKLFHDIVAKNGMSVRKGHTLLANLIPTGEVPLALTAYSYRLEQLKSQGAPVAIAWMPPVVALPTGAGVFKHAPHPAAALLFEDFLLTEGQKILAARKAVPTNPKAGTLPPNLIFVDLKKSMDEGAKWMRLFQETFSRH